MFTDVGQPLFFPSSSTSVYVFARVHLRMSPYVGYMCERDGCVHFFGDLLAVRWPSLRPFKAVGSIQKRLSWEQMPSISEWWSRYRASTSISRPRPYRGAHLARVLRGCRSDADDAAANSSIRAMRPAGEASGGQRGFREYKVHLFNYSGMSSKLYNIEGDAIRTVRCINKESLPTPFACHRLSNQKDSLPESIIYLFIWVF